MTFLTPPTWICCILHPDIEPIVSACPGHWSCRSRSWTSCWLRWSVLVTNRTLPAPSRSLHTIICCCSPTEILLLTNIFYDQNIFSSYLGLGPATRVWSVQREAVTLELGQIGDIQLAGAKTTSSCSCTRAAGSGSGSGAR